MSVLLFNKRYTLSTNKRDKWKLIMRNLVIITGLLTPLIFLIIGLFLHGGLPRKPTAIATNFVPAEVKKDNTADRLASEEKIRGYNNPDALISVYDLSQIIYDPDTYIFDTRGRSYQVYQSNYPRGHIPGAVPIQHSDYSHPKYFDRIATPDQLQKLLGTCGVNNSSTIVLYGNDGLQTRLYWAIKMYGYDKVKILDGGMEKWKQEGFDVSTAKPAGRLPDTFEFDLTKSKTEYMLATMDEVKDAIDNKSYVIVDTRSKAQYLDGHIPGSVNFDYTELFNKDMTFKPVQDLKKLADNKKITSDKVIIVYSEDGVESSIVWFALSELLGFPNVKNYDGSLNEWLKAKQEISKGE